MSAVQRCPAGLGAAGKRLWRAVTADFKLDAGELETLEAACRTRDELREVEASLELLSEFTVRGSRLQPVAHPLLDEVRKHRALLCDLVKSLKIPAEAQNQHSPQWAAVERRDAPAELVDERMRTYRRDDWVQPGDGRFDPFWRWVAARQAWVAKHPNSRALGGRLDRFRDELPDRHRELYPRGATSWD